MKINPFVVDVTIREYIAYSKPEIKQYKSLVSTYNLLVTPIKVEYYENEYLIIGFYTNEINTEIICTLIPTNINNSNYKTIFIDSDCIKIKIEVVLKSELKDIKTVEQLNLFSNEQKSN